MKKIILLVSVMIALFLILVNAAVSNINPSACEDSENNCVLSNVQTCHLMCKSISIQCVHCVIHIPKVLFTSVTTPYFDGDFSLFLDGFYFHVHHSKQNNFY